MLKKLLDEEIPWDEEGRLLFLEPTVIIPPGPYRLELNGELFGRYQSVPSIKAAIKNHLGKGPLKGEFRAFDARGTQIMSHDGVQFCVSMPRPQVDQRSIKGAKPMLVKSTAGLRRVG